MDRIPRFNYDLQELNEWVRADRAEAQFRLARVPGFRYDLQELNQWVARDREVPPDSRIPIDDSTAPIEVEHPPHLRFAQVTGKDSACGGTLSDSDQPTGPLGDLEFILGLVAAGILYVMFLEMVLTLVGL